MHPHDLKLPDKFLDPEHAERLARMIAAFPLPENADGTFVEGFREAQRIACALAMAAGGGDDSGCAPVASPNGFGPAK